MLSPRKNKHPATVTDLSVIAGKYKGTKLLSPRHTSTHPMGAREKNALFNMLQPWIAEAKVLDTYAGSGALGIEALSRGAQEVIFVEQQPVVVQVLRTNLARVGIAAEVVAGTVAKVAEDAAWQGKFNLIIADPPYDHFELDEIIKLHQLLTADGILALSYPGRLGELELVGFQRQATRRYAAAGIGVYQKSLNL